MKICNKCHEAYNDMRQVADCPHYCRNCGQPWPVLPDPADLQEP